MNGAENPLLLMIYRILFVSGLIGTLFALLAMLEAFVDWGESSFWQLTLRLALIASPWICIWLMAKAAASRNLGETGRAISLLVIPAGVFVITASWVGFAAIWGSSI